MIPATALFSPKSAPLAGSGQTIPKRRLPPGSTRALACRGRRPRRPHPCIFPIPIEGAEAVGEGADCDTRGRVCSPGSGNQNQQTPGRCVRCFQVWVRPGAEAQRSTRVQHVAELILDSGRPGRHFAGRKHSVLELWKSATYPSAQINHRDYVVMEVFANPLTLKPLTISHCESKRQFTDSFDAKRQNEPLYRQQALSANQQATQVPSPPA